MIEIISENIWFLLSLGVTIAIGIVAFINKVFAERQYNVRFATLNLFAFMLLYSIVIGSILGFEKISAWYTILCIVWGIQVYAYSFIMIHALKYLPTSTYFISARLLSSFILLGIGIIAFGDIINYHEVIGFILGIIAMLLLFEHTKKENSNYIKGSVYLILGIGCLVFGHTAHKLLSVNSHAIPTMLFICFSAAFFTALIFGYKHIRPNIHLLQQVSVMNFFQSIFLFFYFYFLFSVYQLGDLGISYKIQSYSPFIPIILAAIIYREQISKKKVIAIIITAVSLYFFT